MSSWVVGGSELTYGGPDGLDITAQPGQQVSDIPEESVAWLLAGGFISSPPSEEVSASVEESPRVEESAGVVLNSFSPRAENSGWQNELSPEDSP